jgi:hypothetical protein
MGISHEDITELKKVFDDRYVMIEDCKDVQRQVSSKLSNDDKRIELLINQQKINNWLTLAVASGIIALVIKYFFKFCYIFVTYSHS